MLGERHELHSLCEAVGTAGPHHPARHPDGSRSERRPFGYFVNSNTLEPELFIGGLAEAMQEVIEQELPINQATRDLVQVWVDDTDDLDEERLIKLIERIGKGRFAQALAPHVSDETYPDYVRQALEHIRDAVS